MTKSPTTPELFVKEEAVRFVIDAHRIQRWFRNACPICDERLCFRFKEGKVYWDPRCACNGHEAALVERDCAHVAAIFNAYPAAEADRLWQQFINSRGPACVEC